MYVHHKYIGKGVGKLLVKEMENVAVNIGIKEFHLISTVTALNFYKRLGYRVIKKTSHEIENQKILVYKMSKKLLPDVK